ncbi:hypothetical protein GCM10010964_28450 [Caldovatus sediminis]|uniref:Uncharacterized protein n=1 Tax=Caldovatus sediminis TaxID=2041189 RepID=A0A8J2ZD25_9PROT|nr:hypothetical protein [Caldovatus sediminis]GGG39188.1 hypothetical protein GCM10010964_28450 [Caldovatus sediminis]
MSGSEGPPAPGVLLYTTEDGRTRLACRFEADTLWLTQAQMAELFQTSVPNINIHLRQIFAEGELDPAATIKSYLMVRTEGARPLEAAATALPERRKARARKDGGA